MSFEIDILYDDVKLLPGNIWRPNLRGVVLLSEAALGAFSSTFPSGFFLEPHPNKHNQSALLNRIADHSLEVQG